MEKLGTIGTEDGDGILENRVRSVARDKDGFYYVSTYASASLPKIFDPQGRFVRTVGAVGKGPGELESRLIFGRSAAGKVFVHDGSLGRLSEIEGARHVRTLRAAPVPSPSSFVVLGSALSVYNADIPTPAEAGYPLHYYRGTTKVLSTGVGVASYRSDQPMLLERVLEPVNDSAFWAASVTRFRLELFDHNGNVRRRIDRAPSWFPPYRGRRLTSPDHPPPVRVTAIKRDSLGRIWIAALIPDRNWAAALQRLETPRGPFYAVKSYDDYFDTVVEVLDERTGKRLAAGRIPYCVPFLLDGGVIASFGTTLHDSPVMHLWRLSLIDN